MRHLLIGLALAAATVALGATQDGATAPQGSIATGQTAIGASVDDVDFRLSSTRRAAMFQYVNTTGTATVELQLTCTKGTATDWAQVGGSSKAMTAGSAAMLDIIYPACRYRANVTACAGCNLTVSFFGLPGM
jgi:hypothetical protein